MANVETVAVAPVCIEFFMKLNKYLFNTVNNKERRRGQQSVVWLKRGQPCSHHLHVLYTGFTRALKVLKSP